MLLFLVILSCVYVAALCVLLRVARVNKSMYAAAKGICSFLFLVCASYCWFCGEKTNATLFGLLLGAMVLCAFGDVLLGVANRKAGRVGKKPFIAGAISFTFAHVLFCVLFILRSPINWYDFVFPVLLMGVTWLLEHTDKIRLKKMRPLGYVYTFMVGMMAWKAFESAAYDGIFTMGEIFLTLGAALFLVSDIVLMFLYFGTRRHTLFRGVNLVLYYVGVYLMAVGAYWL